MAEDWSPPSEAFQQADEEWSPPAEAFGQSGEQWSPPTEALSRPHESPLATGFREASEAATTLPGIIAGAEAGAALAAPLAPVTFGAAPFIGALGGGIAGGFLAHKAKEAVLQATGVRGGEGFYSQKRKQAGLEENPESGFAGELVGTAGLGFKAGIGTTPLVQRVLGAGLMGSLEGVNEAIEGQDLNIGHIAEAAGAGAAFATPRAWTKPFQNIGQKIGQTVTGRLGYKPEIPETNPGQTTDENAAVPNSQVNTETAVEPNVSIGTAQEKSPPASNKAETTAPNETEYQVNRSERDYRKEELKRSSAESTVVDYDLIPQDQMAAVLASHDQSSITAKATPGAPQEPVPGGVRTGLEEIAERNAGGSQQPTVPTRPDVPLDDTKLQQQIPGAEGPRPVKPDEARAPGDTNVPREPGTGEGVVQSEGGARGPIEPLSPENSRLAAEAAANPPGPAPKTPSPVVERALKALDLKGTPEAKKLADSIRKLDDLSQLTRAQKRQLDRIAGSDTVPKGPEGRTTRTKSKAAEDTRAMEAMQKVIEASKPVEGETPAQIQQRYKQAVAAARAGNQGLLPTDTFKPRNKPDYWLLMKHMADASEGVLSKKKLERVTADEKLLRGSPEEVDTYRKQRGIAGEIAKSRTGGEEVIAGQEARKAAEDPRSVEDQMLEAIDRQREAEKHGETGEPVPAEDAPTVSSKDIKDASDLTEKASRDLHNDATTRLEYNLPKAFDKEVQKQKKKFGAAPKESEGPASAARRPQVSAEEKQRLLDKFTSASKDKEAAPKKGLPDILARVDPQAKTVSRGGNLTAKYERETTLGNLLQKTPVPKGQGLFTVLLPRIKQALATVAGQTKVLGLRDGEMAKFAPDHPGLLGAYMPDPNGGRGTIVMNLDRLNDETWSRIAVHEAVHEITQTALSRSPAFRKMVNALQREYAFEVALRDLHGETYEYALTNDREFLTEALSNHDVMDVLSGIPVTPELARDLGLPKAQGSLWDQMISVIRRLLNLEPDQTNALEAAIKMVDIADKVRMLRAEVVGGGVKDALAAAREDINKSPHADLDPLTRDLLAAPSKKKQKATAAVTNPAAVPPQSSVPPTGNTVAHFNRQNATYPSWKSTVEKWIAIPLSDYGVMTRSILGEMAATKNQLMASVLNATDHRWWQWLKIPFKSEVMPYLKALETHNTEEMINNAVAAGTSQAHAETAAKADFVDYMKNLLGHGAASPADQQLIEAKAKWMGDEMLVHRKMMKDTFDWDKKFGSQADYVQNYVAHIFKNAGRAADYINDRIQTLGPTWYQKVRMIDLIDEAVNKYGLELRYNNPIDIMTARFQASANANLMVGALREMKDKGLAVELGQATDWQRGQWGDIKFYAGDRQNWLVRPEAQQLFQNALTRQGLNRQDNVGSVYRAWMQLKNVWMPIQLSLSAFHAMHLMAGIIPAQNIARAIQLSKVDGNWLRNLGEAGKVSLDQTIFDWPLDKIGLGLGKALDDWSGGRFSNRMGRDLQELWKMTPDQLKNASTSDQFRVAMAKEGGYAPFRPQQDIAGMKRKYGEAREALRQDPSLKNLSVTAWRALGKGLEAIQQPMFNHWIPQVKNELWERGVAALMKTEWTKMQDVTQRRVLLHNLKNNIDDRFGEMFYDSKFWNPYVKDVAIGSMVSVGWNVGQLNQTGGAIRNLALKATGKGTPLQRGILKADDKVAFVATYVALSMGLAGMMTYALTGGDAPKNIMDFTYPRTGLTNKDGTPARFNIQSNIREVPTFIGHMQQDGSAVSAAAHVLYNKTILQPVVDWATNKDFFGREISDTNSPWILQQLQKVDSILGEHVSPIATTSAKRAGEVPGAGGFQKSMAYLGWGPAPGYIGHSAMENRILGLSRERRGPLPYEYGEKTGLGRGLVQGAVRGLQNDPLTSEARRAGVTELAKAKAEGRDTSEIYRNLSEQGHMGKQALRHTEPTRQVEQAFARLPIEDQQALVRHMTGAEFHRFVLANPERFANGGAKARLIATRNQ